LFATGVWGKTKGFSTGCAKKKGKTEGLKISEKSQWGHINALEGKKKKAASGGRKEAN